MKKRIVLLCGLGIIIILSVMLFVNNSKKEHFLLTVAQSVFSQQQEAWFSYANIDTLYSRNKFRYFVFYKEGSLSVDRDSALFVLSENLSLPDSVILKLKNKVYLPLSAFPYLMSERDGMILCRVDSFDKRDGKGYYKLHKVMGRQN